VLWPNVTDAVARSTIVTIFDFIWHLYAKGAIL